nr:hypothetical protein [uncultured Acetatifactor sp.]
MGNSEMTVEKLHNLLRGVVEAGYGNIPVKIGEDVLHDDSIAFNYYGDDKWMKIRGILYNHPQYEKIAKFKEDVEKAWEELMK